MNLFEKYNKRMALAEKLHKKTHDNEPMTESKKILVAKCLENTEKFMESYAATNSMGTQRSDMGAFTRFSMNLTNVALPNLIATDIVMTYPMSSMSGYVNYIQFVAGSNKGNTSQGTVFNDPFRLGNVDVEYTSSKVSKTYELTEDTSSFELSWKSVVAGTVSITAGDTVYYDDGNGGLVVVPDGGSIERVKQIIQPVDGMDDQFEGTEEKVITTIKDEDGKVVTDTVGTIDYEGGLVTFTDAITTGTKVNISYAYNNVTIPQNDIPLLSARMRTIPLLAKARRVAMNKYVA